MTEDILKDTFTERTIIVYRKWGRQGGGLGSELICLYVHAYI